MMELFRWDSKRHGTVVLTRERWNHICSRHQEIPTIQENVRGALSDPDFIERSLTDPDARLYYKKLGGKYVVVVVQIEEGFVKTAYLSESRKGGELVWER